MENGTPTFSYPLWGELGGYIIVHHFRRLAWPGLLGVGIFSEMGKEFAEK